MVAMLHSYIADRFCQGDKERVLTDSIGSDSIDRPPSIGSHVPDAYVMLDRSGRVILGEAKSLRDLENSHTEAQLTAFLRRCNSVDHSTLVLAVPWPIERLAKALLLSLQVREGLSHIEIAVISEAHHLQTLPTRGRSVHCSG